MQTYNEIEAEVRKLAHSLPPSDFGSARAIHAAANFVMQKLEAECAEQRDLVRRLDVALNGDGAAPQASLCDLVSQFERKRALQDWDR